MAWSSSRSTSSKAAGRVESTSSTARTSPRAEDGNDDLGPGVRRARDVPLEAGDVVHALGLSRPRRGAADTPRERDAQAAVRSLIASDDQHLGARRGRTQSRRTSRRQRGARSRSWRGQRSNRLLRREARRVARAPTCTPPACPAHHSPPTSQSSSGRPTRFFSSHSRAMLFEGPITTPARASRKKRSRVPVLYP